MANIDIVFLDIDGILNSRTWDQSHKRDIENGLLIDERKVELLAQLEGESDAKIVLHSGWKYWFSNSLEPLNKEAEILKNLFSKHLIEIYDKTPDLAGEKIREGKVFSLVKAKEIKSWLDRHKGSINNWIVIDDLDLHDRDILAHQVNPDPDIGLTYRDVQLGIKMLKK